MEKTPKKNAGKKASEPVTKCDQSNKVVAICDQFFHFLTCQLKPKPFWETCNIPFHPFIEVLGFYTIKHS